MSPEPTGVHGLLKQRKLFTHKLKYIFKKNNFGNLVLRFPSYQIYLCASISFQLFDFLKRKS